jgi:hypothetical protein
MIRWPTQARQRRPLTIAAAMMALGLAGCTSASPAQGMFERYNGDATPQHFVVCQSYGCSTRTPAAFTDQEWAEIAGQFTPPPQTAEDERERIARAVALMERVVGPKTGTENDRPGAPVIAKDTKGQMDCLDEATNTGTYLAFLEQAGLFRFHDKARAVRRGYLIDGLWTHNTATVIERATQRRFTVDTWFRKNGDPPVIVPVEDWLAGYYPPDFKR